MSAAAAAATTSALAHDKSKALKFFIFGHPVTSAPHPSVPARLGSRRVRADRMSPSPEIHNVGFAENGFPHRYERCDTDDAAAVLETLRRPTTGGGSVTIPHKESVLPEMDVLSESAKTIGAVNTVTKLPDGKLHGDNTDWLGIKNQIEARLARRAGGAKPGGRVGLICGAGGTAKAAAYALQQMGCAHVIIVNRTLSRAEALAKEFGKGYVASADPAAALAAHDRLDFVVNTLPGSTGYVLPAAAAAVLKRHTPIVVEASYIPRHTAFVEQVPLASPTSCCRTSTRALAPHPFPEWEAEPVSSLGLLVRWLRRAARWWKASRCSSSRAARSARPGPTPPRRANPSPPRSWARSSPPAPTTPPAPRCR